MSVNYQIIFLLEQDLASNIVFPNKFVDDKGFNSLKENEIKKRLEKYSTKFNRIIKQLKRKRKIIYLFIF